MAKAAAARKMSLALALSLALILAGCGKENKAEREALEIQALLRNLEAAAGEVKLEAEYDETVFSCVLDVAYDRAEGCKMTFLEPEEVEGVTVGLKENGLTLGYGDFVLDTGPLLSDSTAPVAALGTLVRLAAEGTLTQAAADADSVELRFRGEDSGLEGWARFSSPEHAPLEAELYEDGARVVTLRFREFTLTGNEE